MVAVGEKGSPLLAAVYTDFDNKLGPEIGYQYPNGFLTPEQFDGVSDYLITGNKICEKIVVITAFGYTIVGYPVEIPNVKYDRNMFFFNVSFVFVEGAFTAPYHSLLKKLGSTLKSMETTSGFLVEEGSKPKVGAILEQVMHGILERGEAVLRLDDSHALALRLLWPPAAAQEVYDSDVPVRSAVVFGSGWDTAFPPGFGEGWQIPAWGLESHFDLALVQVMPHIDGVKHAKKISIDAEVDIDVVKRTLRALLFYNQITLVDTFDFFNVYDTTDKTSELLRDPEFARGCWEIIKRVDPPPEENAFDGGAIEGGGWSSNNPFHWGTGGGGISPPARCQPPDRSELLKLYCSFGEGRTVGDVLLMNKGLLEAISHHRFCSFGVETGILRRVHHVPICIKKEQLPPAPAVYDQGEDAATATAATAATIGAGASTPTSGRGNASVNIGSLRERYNVEEIQALMNGQRTEDALRCHLMCTWAELEAFVTSDGLHEVIRLPCV